MQMQGASAALPLYYCALNLAKAELLIAGETTVKSKLHHGLRYDQNAAAQLRSDRVSIAAKGVFPSLYRLRLGRSTGVRGMAAVRLDSQLARMSEISAEAELLGLPGRECLRAHLFRFGSGKQFAMRLEVLQTEGVSLLDRRTASVAEFKKSLGVQFQALYAPTNQHLLESRQDWNSEDDAAKGVARILAPYASASDHDIVLRPCLRIDDVTRTLGTDVVTKRLLPIPDHIARYVFVFMMSSIVRYVPARFEACGDEPLKALVDVAVDDARSTILLDSALFLARTLVTQS